LYRSSSTTAQQSWVDRVRELLKDFEVLLDWIDSAIQQPSSGDEGSEMHLLRGYVACKAVNILSESRVRTPEWWIAPTNALMKFIYDFMLPTRLLRENTEALNIHRVSPMCQLTPEVGAAMSLCISHIPEPEQVDVVLIPIEGLTESWSEWWHQLTPEDRGDGTVKGWFAKTLFLFIGTLIRKIALKSLGSAALLHCLRSLASVDAQKVDSQEYRALCLSVVEIGAEKPGFVDGLLRMLPEFCAPTLPADAGTGPLSKLHFLLGVLTTPKVMGSPSFFPIVSPIILSCITNDSTGGAVDVRKQLSVRAHALTSVCIEEVGTDGHADFVKEYVLAGMGGISRHRNSEIIKAMTSSVDALAKNVAQQRNGRASSKEIIELGRWILWILSQEVQERLDHDEHDLAEGFFKIWCRAACHIDLSSVPEPFYSDHGLQKILKQHVPLRNIWLKTLLSGFPEIAREILIARFLKDFPESAAADNQPKTQTDAYIALIDEGKKQIATTLESIRERIFPSKL